MLVLEETEAVLSNPLKIMGTSEHNDQETDRILSEELLKLSFDERNKINEEMHGVRDDFPEFKEHPEATELSLLDMECEIESILLNSENNKCAGLKLEHIPKNREFRLAFLRCELHDATKAAHRLVRYIRLIRERCSCRGGVAGCACGCIEGGENGGRIVASKWFTKEEYSAMKKGVIQLMPYRDRSGRRVVIPLSACFKLSIVMRLKIFLYLVAGAMEDAESQKRGMVILIWPGMSESVAPSSSSMLANIQDRGFAFDVQMSTPLRIVCVHFGNAKSPILSFVKALMVGFLEKRFRARFNIITGAITELNYKIMTFGIHPAMLPVSDTGIIKIRNHVKWLEARINIEKDPYGSKKTSATGGVMVECPGMNDVLFNRGKSCQHHPGNVTFRSMVESKKHRHMIANQTEKKEIAWEVMEEVENRNGRFFYWDKSGWWAEFEDRTEIRHKVATSLRDFNKQVRAIENRQNTHSSTNAFRNQNARKRKREEDNGSSSDCSCGL